MLAFCVFSFFFFLNEQFENGGQMNNETVLFFLKARRRLLRVELRPERAAVGDLLQLEDDE